MKMRGPPGASKPCFGIGNICQERPRNISKGYGPSLQLCIAAAQSSGERRTSRTLIEPRAKLVVGWFRTWRRGGPESNTSFKTRHSIVRAIYGSSKSFNIGLDAENEPDDSGLQIFWRYLCSNLVVTKLFVWA